VESVFAAFERTARRNRAKPFLDPPGLSYADGLEHVRALAVSGRGAPLLVIG